MTTRILGPLDTGGTPLSPRRAILEAVIVRHGAVVAQDSAGPGSSKASP